MKKPGKFPEESVFIPSQQDILDFKAKQRKRHHMDLPRHAAGEEANDGKPKAIISQ